LLINAGLIDEPFGQVGVSVDPAVTQEGPVSALSIQRFRIDACNYYFGFLASSLG
jgi:hypothetical protein